MSSGRLPHPCCTASRDIRLRGGIPTHFDAGPLGIECRTTSALANFLNKMDGCRSDQLEARGTRARIKMLCHKPCIFDSVLFLVGPREALFVEPRQLGFALRFVAPVFSWMSLTVVGSLNLQRSIFRPIRSAPQRATTSQPAVCC